MVTVFKCRTCWKGFGLYAATILPFIVVCHVLLASTAVHNTYWLMRSMIWLVYYISTLFLAVLVTFFVVRAKEREATSPEEHFHVVDTRERRDLYFQRKIQQWYWDLDELRAQRHRRRRRPVMDRRGGRLGGKIERTVCPAVVAFQNGLQETCDVDPDHRINMKYSRHPITNLSQQAVSSRIIGRKKGGSNFSSLSSVFLNEYFDNHRTIPPHGTFAPGRIV